MFIAPVEALYTALPVEVFSTVPPEIVSRAVVVVPLLAITIVPLVALVFAEVTFVVAPAGCDTVIVPVEELHTALPVVAETVPPEMFTAPAA